MNKKILGFIAIVVFAVIATVNVNIASQERGISNLAYANMEALADDEDNPPPCYTCTGGSSAEYYTGYDYVTYDYSPNYWGPHPNLIVIGCHGRGDRRCE